ncbi:hypothetical protein [Kitasatospora sp. McL0602]|uniref:hypothetical protein n=1 Tax=Kitasatospora sp. McL0602 TaxID=3439530 RepID=UPI003F8CC4AA
MRTWIGGIALAVLALAAVTGCSGSGQLHDAGQTRSVTAHPSPQLLWPAAVVSPSPTAVAPADQPPPTALPGLTAPSGDPRSLDARTVLAKDPGLSTEERAALAGCQGCLVQDAKYRDLSGDGRPELITAVVTATEGAYLHVYTVRDGQVFPVLGQKVLAGFTADTAGSELVVHEPNGPDSQTNTRYGWRSVRMVLIDRQIKGTGPTFSPTVCAPTAGPPRPSRSASDNGTSDGNPRPGPAVSAAPTFALPSGLPSGVRSAAPSAVPSIAPVKPSP